MAKLKKFLGPASSQRGQLSGGKKLFLISTHFGRVASQNVSLPSNLHPNLALLLHFLILLTLKPCNLGWNGRNLILFVAITKPARSGFWGKKTFSNFDPFWLHSGPKCDPTVNNFALLSRWRPISQARKVKMRLCKRPTSSSWCGQCRQGWWKGPTPSWGSGRHQEGSILWANCNRLACFSGGFSRKCLPVNWNGCGECGGGSRDRQGGHGDRMTTCPHRLQLQTSWTGGHLDWEDGNSERQVLGKSCSHYPDTRRRETFSVDLTVCKLQTSQCTH